MRLYVCADQSQNKLIRITILLHNSTSRGKEMRVADALRLKHIFSIFLLVTAHYQVVSTIGKTNTIAIRCLKDRSILGIRHVMVNSNLLPLIMEENMSLLLKKKRKSFGTLPLLQHKKRISTSAWCRIAIIIITQNLSKKRDWSSSKRARMTEVLSTEHTEILMLQWQLIAETVPVSQTSTKHR